MIHLFWFLNVSPPNPQPPSLAIESNAENNFARFSLPQVNLFQSNDMPYVCPNFCHFPEEKISVSILGTCKLIHGYIYNAHCVFIEMNDKDRQEKPIPGTVLYLWFQKLNTFLKISIFHPKYITFEFVFIGLLMRIISYYIL